MAEGNGDELVKASQLARELLGISYKSERVDEKISEIVREALAIEARVRSLESYTQSRAIIEAREDERDKALREQLGRMEYQIKDTRDEIKVIKSVGTRALWIVGGAALSGITLFVVKAVLT